MKRRVRRLGLGVAALALAAILAAVVRAQEPGPPQESLALRAGLNLVGWFGAATTSTQILAGNPDLVRIWGFDAERGAWLLDDPALPAAQRSVVPITRGTGFFVVAARATTLVVALGPLPPPIGGDQGPYYHQVLLATSSDGLAWTAGSEVVRDHASVPEIARLADGRLMLYFVDGTVPGTDTRAMRQTESGAWEDVDFVIDDRPSTRSWDPDVVILPDGRVRLYYYAPAESPGPGEGPHEIHSAISDDGITFTFEEGARLRLENVFDPSVAILPDGTWLMAVGSGQGTELASSTDGLDFTPTGVVVSLGGVPELTVLGDGRVRLSVTTIGGILSTVSADGGQTWTTEPGVRLAGGADPSIVQLGPDEWLMAWKRIVASTTP